MTLEPYPIVMLSGTPGTGKTSVAQALLQHFPLGLHLPLDDFREFVVSGRASIFNWDDETTRQFTLARQSAVGAAAQYAEAGFAVVLDDVVFPAEAETQFVQSLSKFLIVKVLLLPSLASTLSRNAVRTTKRFDTAELEATIIDLHQTFTARKEDFVAAGWLIIDSSELTLAQTVAVIIEQLGK